MTDRGGHPPALGSGDQGVVRAERTGGDRKEAGLPHNWQASLLWFGGLVVATPLDDRQYPGRILRGATRRMTSYAMVRSFVQVAWLQATS